ncbi:MAG TPA: hypothetical protein PLD25_27530 [Chloroflexota bacterium]|nr:hypothetical protein [Chloroflexota bacterium]HUM70339.1 hypothetical protein [Chloroflexota bacterium]
MVGAYSLGAVLQKWEKGELSTDQAVGQTLLLVQELSDRVGKLERQVMGERPLADKRPLPEKRPPDPKNSL